MDLDHMEVVFHTIVLLSPGERPLSPIAETLRHLPGAHLHTNPSLAACAGWGADTLVVVDCAVFTGLSARYFATAVCTHTPCALLLVNGTEKEYADLLCFAGFKGLLPPPVSARQMLRAIAALRRGELCFSRRLMSRQLEELRDHEAYAPPPGELTAREWRVLLLMAEGHSNATIATLLHLSPHTIKTHSQKIFRKIGAANRTQAARWARQRAPRALGDRPEEPGHAQTVA